jgi:two-component system, chemotaxis family, CheB/CheR fusion protein
LVSAGGLAAFRSFFDHMPADTGMAFVLVMRSRRGT